MNHERIKLVVRRPDGVDEIEQDNFVDFAEAAHAALAIAQQISKDEDTGADEQAVSILLVAAHRIELVIKVVPGRPLF